MGWPTSGATSFNCSRAAGRYTSTDTIVGLGPFLESQRASLPVEVVLLEPCKPTIRMTLGGSLAKRSLDWWLPRIRGSSSRTMAIICWVGEREASTSAPIAFSLTASISCLTTLKLTSASRRATRISHRAVSMFAAESLPSPRRFLKTRCSLSDKLSNMTASDYSRLRGEIDTRPGCRAVAFIYYRGVGGSLLVGLEAALGL